MDWEDVYVYIHMCVYLCSYICAYKTTKTCIMDLRESKEVERKCWRKKRKWRKQFSYTLFLKNLKHSFKMGEYKT